MRRFWLIAAWAITIPPAHAQAQQASASLVEAVLAYDRNDSTGFGLADADSTIADFRQRASMQRVRLNADRYPDYLVWMHPQVCGTSNCPFWIVRGTASGPEVLGWGSSAGLPRILRNHRNGHAIIKAQARVGQTYPTIRYVFDGIRYVGSPN